MIVAPIGLYYRIKSHTGEKLDRRREGLFIMVPLRVLAGFAFLGLLAYLIEPRWMRWSSVFLPAWLRWAGVGVGTLGSILFIWTFHTLGPNLTDTVVTRVNHSLVTTGPYRWVRHPFYTAGATLLLGTFLVTANLFILVTGGLVIFMLVLRTRKEEANLLERFGDDYQQYMRRTGRFLPRL